MCWLVLLQKHLLLLTTHLIKQTHRLGVASAAFCVSALFLLNVAGGSWGQGLW